MRPVLVYPGTNIPLIRGGAPDAPPADGGTPAAPAAPAGSGAALPAAGGDPKPASGSGAAASPSEDWQKKYSDLEGRYKQYERFGKPEDIDGFVNQARTNKAQLDKIYADFQDGKLTYAQAKAAAKDAQEQQDPFDGYDTLEPREQGQRLLGTLRKEFEEFTKGEIAKINQAVTTQSTNLSTQMKLAWKLLQTARNNPDVNIEDIIAQSTEASAYSPEQIIDMMVDRAGAPKKQEQAIAKAVAEARAEWQREADAKRVPPPSRSMPRIAPKAKPESPVDRHDKVYNKFLDRLDAANSGK